MQIIIYQLANLRQCKIRLHFRITEGKEKGLMTQPSSFGKFPYHHHVNAGVAYKRTYILDSIADVVKNAKGLSWKTALVIIAGWVVLTLSTQSCSDFKVTVKNLEISAKH